MERLWIKLGLCNAQPLDELESTWLSAITSSAQNSPLARQPKLADWEICLEDDDFINWRCSLEEHCLFFDGASKGNPGPSGGGGVILTPSGSTRSSFAWGLGVESNNFAEFYALWQGLRQAIRLNIRSISIFGDSKIVVQAMHTKSRPTSLPMKRIFQKILVLAGKFHSISYYHVLRHLNSLADLEANHAMLLSRGTITENGFESFCFIP